MTGCSIAGNLTSMAGGGVYCDLSSPVIINCTIAENQAGVTGGGIYCWYGSSPVITSSTITENSAVEAGGGIYCPGQTDLTISNCILWNDSPEEIWSNSGNLVVTYSDIEGGWTGEGNIDADPRFLTPEFSDFHLRFDSPCMNTGSDCGVYEDIDGNPRPQGAGFDMGSDEIRFEGPVLQVAPGSFKKIGILDEYTEDDTLTISSIGNETLEYSVTPGSESWLSLIGEQEGVLQPGEHSAILMEFDISLLGIGVYMDTITIISDDPLSPSQIVPVKLEVWSDGIIHVPEDIGTIQEAIDLSCEGATVLVADGTYSGSGNFDIDFSGKAITVASENGASGAVIDCKKAGRGFSFHSGESENSRLEGFTILYGSSSEACGGGIYCRYSSPSIIECFISNNSSSLDGSGIYCLHSSPVIKNCTITGNRADGSGGGIFCCLSSAPIIIDCTITGNQTDNDGGGIFCSQSSPTITNCMINGNWASDDGAGIYCNVSSPSLTNCTITRNASDSGGGIFCYASTPAIINCTITENSVGFYGGGIYCNVSSPPITNCTITGNMTWRKGGGVYCYYSNPIIANCRLAENSAVYHGGGIYCDRSAPTISNCAIIGNTSDAGGGIRCDYSSPSIMNCTISENSVRMYGGGICCRRESDPDIANCTITGNTAVGRGGGISCTHSCAPNMTNCKIVENSSASYGGGISCHRYSDPVITNCTIAGNTAGRYGGGIACTNSCFPIILNCTLSGNIAVFDGGGIFCQFSSPEISNSILWGDSPEELFVNEGNPEVTYSDIDGGWGGEGNIDSNPHFISYGGFDFLLRPQSPCIDAGDPNIEDAIYDRHPLCPDWYINGIRSDMGAYGGPGNVEWF